MVKRPQKPPHWSKVRYCFKLGVEQCFQIEGTDFDSATKVHLVESTGTIVWSPELVTTFVERKPTFLRFVSTPKARDEANKPGRPTGTLTITVTNPDGDDADPATVPTSYN
jgi:hypothetical protein